MQEQLIKYLSKYVEITEELKQVIVESSIVQNYPKGTVLLKTDEKSNECFFVLKGCIRSYCQENGEEKTIEFYTEEQVASPPSYGTDAKSKIQLECIVETWACVGTPEVENENFQKFPQLESLARVMNEVLMTKHQEDMTEFKFLSPEKRYLNLLEKRPYLLQMAPQHQIASYLGMKPESLSRIRKRLANRDHYIMS